jgi:hypothetical protein
MKPTRRRVGPGEYEYRGRYIYRRDDHRGAYNPWKIALTKHTFATLADAVRYIDQKEEGKS